MKWFDKRHRRTVGIAVIFAVVAGGVTRHAPAECKCCGEDRPVMIAAPLGTYSHAWQCGQIRAAHPAVVVHKADWIGASDRLSPFMTSYLLSKMTAPGCAGSHILVEPSGSPDLDERRRLAVVDYFAQTGLSVPIEAVSVGNFSRDRLRGDDANRVLENFGYQRTRAQSTQFNPLIGLGAPTNTSFGIPTRGGTLPAFPGTLGF